MLGGQHRPENRAGRARAARNALRHALSLPVYSDPVLSEEEMDALAREIAGPDAKAEILGLARRVAEAEIDLTRALSDPAMSLKQGCGKRMHWFAARAGRRSHVVEFCTRSLRGPFKLAITLVSC